MASHAKPTPDERKSMPDAGTDEDILILRATIWAGRPGPRALQSSAQRPQAHHQLAHMRAACSAVAVAVERACLSFCGTLLPRRGLKLGYLVQEDGEQIGGGLVSGAAGLIGFHCLPK
jgi:hypothetical protein